MDKDADIYAHNNWGDTAYSLAYKKGHTDIRMMLKNRAKFDRAMGRRFILVQGFAFFCNSVRNKIYVLEIEVLEPVIMARYLHFL
jgi:hypothetical protein